MSMNTQNETPEKTLEEKFEELIEEYKKENNSNDFLLFDLANANENAHTKVLLWLLSHKDNKEKYIFLPSFLKLLDIDYNDNIDYKISGQEKAIGNKGTGFIDLYIEAGENKIIIENKIYDAPDTGKQLARYIATIDGVEDNLIKIEDKNRAFDNWYKGFENNRSRINNTNIYVVYLTADGQKEPSESSLPERIKKQLRDNYRPLNYDADILPWLEKDVLPQVPYMKRGVLLAGIIQYIDYLRTFLSASKKSEVVNGFVCNEYDSFPDFMRDIKKLHNKYSKNKEYKDIANPLFKEMMSTSESIFFNKDKIGEEWCIHVLLNSIIIYKKDWAALDKRNYTIPTLHLVANNSDYLKEKGGEGNLKWKLEVDHLKVEENKDNKKGTIEKNYDYSNHDKTFWFKLSRLKLTSFVSFEDNNNDIEKIDSAIEEYKESNPSGEDNPNLLLDKLYDRIK